MNAAGAAGAANPAGGASSDLRLVLCNTPPEKAEEIAREVVEKHLAACVNVIPRVSSYYFWDGKMCVDTESTLLMKTRAELVEPLTQAIRAIHPYSVPEVIAVPLASGEGNPDYLTWVLTETAGGLSR